MARKIAYSISTVIVAGLSLLAARSYLSGDPHVIQAFARLDYPQQLRIILGIAKPLGAIILVIPGVPRLKEWAYAGFTFAWTCAFASLQSAFRLSVFVPTTGSSISQNVVFSAWSKITVQEKLR
jgi:hypothetical protein